MKWSRLVAGGDCPPRLIGHSLHAIGPDEILVFGGFTRDPSAPETRLPFGPWADSLSPRADVYILNTQSLQWRRVETKGNRPSARGFHAGCYDVRAHRVLVHGGWEGSSTQCVSGSCIFSLDIESMTWTQTELSGSELPTDRAGHSMVYSFADDKCFLFGHDGLSDNCLYEISKTGECKQTEARGTRPLARRFLSLQLTGSRLYCFGGETNLPGLTDVYVFCLRSRRWTRPLYEGSITLRAHATCVLNDKLMVFGGVREKASTTVAGTSEFSIAKKLFFLTALEIKENASDSVQESSQFKFKIVTVGDSGVGKSCLLTRFVSDVYSDFHLSTIGVDYKTVVTMVKGKLVKLLLWDTAGQERFSVVTGTYYRNADAFVIVYDATNRSSFDRIDYWLNQIKQNHEFGPETIKLLCANKSDLVQNVIVSEGEGREKAQQVGAVFVVASAKTSGNVDMAFLTVAQQLVENRKIKQQEATNHSTEGHRFSGVNLTSGLPSRPGSFSSQSNCCA
jgi:Ras-related protein Rab-1A